MSVSSQQASGPLKTGMYLFDKLGQFTAIVDQCRQMVYKLTYKKYMWRETPESEREAGHFLAK